MPLARLTDDERRARLARRHAIAPNHRVGDVEAATRAVVALHATEPASVYLSAWARVDQLSVADVDAALYETRCLVKQLAMRRTLFVFPRELLPAVLGSASARVAASEARRVAKAVEAGGLADDGDAWLAQALSAVCAEIADGDGLSAQQVRERVAAVQGQLTMAPGRTWGGQVHVAPWVLTSAGLRGHLVRGLAAGHWRNPRHVWVAMRRWLGEVGEPLPSEQGYAELVRRWLARFGPGTADDLVWWLGSTKTAVRAALADVAAVQVQLDDGQLGWVLPDDVEPGPAVEPWAALLPTLDPTTMGWKQRDFYLDPSDAPYLFDTNGNGGTTAWWNGRVVGCWVQDPDGVVRVVTRRDPGVEARQALDQQAERLTQWLDGVVVNSVYASPQMRGERLP